MGSRGLSLTAPQLWSLQYRECPAGDGTLTGAQQLPLPAEVGGELLSRVRPLDTPRLHNFLEAKRGVESVLHLLAG